MYMAQPTNFYTLSRLFSAQYADERAEKTDPLSLREQVPIFRADSRTFTAETYLAWARSSCPITEIITKGDLSSFIVWSWR